MNIYPSGGGIGSTTTISPFGDLIAQPLTPLVQVDFVYGINSQQGAVTINTTGVGDASVGRLRLQTGTGAAGSATYTTRRPAQYRPGQGMIARLTMPMTTGVANSTQIAGAGDANDGYFFGFNGATFGVLHRNNNVDTWIAQSTWNGDKCDGTGGSGFIWNKTFGIPVQICYPYLGYGNITFWVQNPETTQWLLCHTVRYADTTSTTEVRNPDLGLYFQAINSGNTTNLTMYVGSASIFMCGELSLLGKPKWAADNLKTTITAETNIVSIRNCTTMNGVTNHGLIRINSVSMASTSNNGAAILRIKIGPTVAGSPSFTPISGSTADNGVTLTSANSIASFDIAGTTVTAGTGTYIFNLNVGSPGNANQDIQDLDIFVGAGETCVISAFSTASTTIQIGVNWTEDI